MSKARIPTVADAFLASARWTPAQIGRGFFAHCKNPTRAAIAHLVREERRGLYASRIVDSCPVPTVAEPLYFGPPNRQPDDYGHLSYVAEQRRMVASIPQRIFWATSIFAGLYGTWAGHDELVRPELVSHDLLLSDVWLRYLERDARTATENWKSEQQLQWEHRNGVRLPSIPDALITKPHRTTAIEVLGRYPASWIAHHCKRFRKANWHIAIW